MNVQAIKLYVSYNQIVVRDSACQLRGLAWNEQLFRQGFARRVSFVAFSCDIDTGPLWLRLKDNRNESQWCNYSRVVEVPFLTESGEIFLENAEDPRDQPQAVVAIAPGWYSLLFGQLLNEERHMLTGFASFVPSDDQERKCQVHRHEDASAVNGRLIEMADVLV